MEKLDIQSKVVGVCTDNGSDIKKAALEGFKERFACLAHNINLTISKGNKKSLLIIIIKNLYLSN